MNTSQYAFVDRAQEQRRLATQAELLDSLTEPLPLRRHRDRVQCRLTPVR
jgi:hypothetical protein